MDLNGNAYSVSADQLLRGAMHPLDMRTIAIKNPKEEIKRGALVKAASDGSYFIAGDVDDSSSALTGDVIGILSHNVAKDESSETISVAVFISGGFNVHAISGVNDYAATEADILSAQKYGLYIHS